MEWQKRNTGYNTFPSTNTNDVKKDDMEYTNPTANSVSQPAEISDELDSKNNENTSFEDDIPF